MDFITLQIILSNNFIYLKYCLLNNTKRTSKRKFLSDVGCYISIVLNIFNAVLQIFMQTYYNGEYIKCYKTIPICFIVV